MKRNAAIATVLVLVHLVIAVFHGEAHASLGVDLVAWQWSYVYIVIMAMPLVAMVLYWTPWQTLGGLLLCVSMRQLRLRRVLPLHRRQPRPRAPPARGGSAGMFVATAVLLAVVEAAATAFGFWTFVKVKPRANIPTP